MSSNVIELSRVARWRALVAHQRGDVRRALRTLTETGNTVVVEAANGEAALALLERGRFDLLVLELDLPVKDGVTVMQVHRILLAHQRARVDPPAVIFILAPEVRGNAALVDHLLSLGVAGLIDQTAQPEVAALVQAVLQERSELSDDKPAVGS